VRTSYKQNDFGEIFYRLMRTYKPETVVELGVLDGYSTLHMLKGIQRNDSGRLWGYDLWDDYDYKHGDMEQVYEMLREEGVSSYVTLMKGDAFEVYDEWSEYQIDFLHVDISNDGEVIREIMELWHPKVSGIIVFEGGSEERDNVDWMDKFDKESIVEELRTNKLINDNYVYYTYDKFPSMTIMFRR
jgi:predicted O-methyltransferase YrrM